MTPEQRKPWWQHRSWLIGLVILFALPLAIGTIPPLIDLPTHMARYRIGIALPESRELARYFAFQWRFIPNLGVDVFVTALAPFLGLEPAVRIIVSIIPALMAAGMVLISRVAHGRVPATMFFVLPLSFAYPMIFGFVNSCLALAFAFLAFGLWLSLIVRERFHTAAVFAGLVAPIILTTHIVGYGVFGICIFGATIGRLLEERTSFKVALREILLACLPVAWPFVILTLWSTGTAPPAGGWFDWHTRVSWLAGLLRDRWAPFDIASALLVYAVMLLPLLRHARFAYAPRIAFPGLFLWILALCLPTTLITQFASVRLIYVACALTLLAVRPRGEASPGLAYAGIAFIALRLLSTGLSTVQASQRIDRELAALDHIARGSRVIALEAIDCERRWNPARLSHLPAMATVRRDAFVNDQFVTSEGQLLSIRDDQPVLKHWTSAIVFKSQCDRWGGLRTLSATLGDLPWGDMDYLWLIDAPALSRPSDPRLRPVWQAGTSILYRVESPKKPDAA